MACTCQIIPNDVLRRFAGDRRLTAAERRGFADTAAVSAEVRKFRIAAGRLTALTASIAAEPTAVPTAPAITVADCHHAQALPGTPVANPATSSDGTVARAAVETAKVADFYQSVFGRNSVDGAGMTLASSVHYGTGFNNAFWNGMRMTYGDGDGNIFIDFTRATDVIAHELTHGVTQHSLRLGYTNEAGGLNESISDVFGTMFRQWRGGQDVAAADWLIGHDIMGPGATARGFTCLRDMVDPAARHCLAAQPATYADYKPGMDPHYSSGIPNRAFAVAARAIGGKSWEKAGQVWYRALTGFAPNPSLKMAPFARRTRGLARSMFPGDPAVAAGVDAGWVSVGL